ncbi:unnamed protein product [Amoebophrya sp. A120]|nr:unnamed protein product [Amoebophrya sp. A120]|eukprot:GSA120T00005062001.1
MARKFLLPPFLVVSEVVPSAVASPAADGRAAVCLFGDVRTVGHTWPDGMLLDFDEENVDRWMRGSPPPGGSLEKFGNNAASVHQHLYPVLADNGGFDVFAITLPSRPLWKYMLFAPSTVSSATDANQSVEPPGFYLSHEQSATAFEGSVPRDDSTIRLVPHIAKEQPLCGISIGPNAKEHINPLCKKRVMMYQKSEEPVAQTKKTPFDPKDPKWSTFMWKRGSATWRSSVGMNTDVANCFKLIQRRENELGYQYRYIIRLRPDMVFLSSFPSPRELFMNKRGSSAESGDQLPGAATVPKATIFVNSVSTYCCGNPDLFAIGLREAMTTCYTNMEDFWGEVNEWFPHTNTSAWLYNRPEMSQKWSNKPRLDSISLRWTPEDWKYALCEHLGVTLEPLDSINMTLLRSNLTGRHARFIEPNTDSVADPLTQWVV